MSHPPELQQAVDDLRGKFELLQRVCQNLPDPVRHEIARDAFELVVALSGGVFCPFGPPPDDDGPGEILFANREAHGLSLEPLPLTFLSDHLRYVAAERARLFPAGGPASDRVAVRFDVAVLEALQIRWAALCSAATVATGSVA